MVCGICGFSGPPGATSCPGCGAPARWYQLIGLGQALVFLLTADAVLGLPAVFLSGMRAVAGVLAAPIGVVFLVWFYRARHNAAASGWRQRLAPGWAIGGWLVPVIFFWIPYMVMADIWRAGLEADERKRLAILPGAWWACWILAWLTGFRHTAVVSGSGGYQHTGSMYGVYFDGTRLSALFAAAAAALLAVIVHRVSTGPVGGPLPASEASVSYPPSAGG